MSTPAQHAGDVTLSMLLHDASAQLSHRFASARLDAEVLLAHALNVERSYLYTWPDRHIPPAQAQAFASLLQQRMQGVPVAYLTGMREFWSLALKVTPATLIPRPETETLVEQALEIIPADARWNILELGTGSGAIALALAHERPHCRITATDRSTGALSVAVTNADRLGINNITFLHSDWFHNLPADRYPLIVSNPPYVRADDPHLREGDVQHEPVSALSAGADGLDCLRHIISYSPAFLCAPGYLLLEHGFDQAAAVDQLLQQHGYNETASVTDTAGQPRVSLGRYINNE